MSKIQNIPEWFDGTIGTENEIISNPFTGESIELNPLEVAMYDLVMGANMIASEMDLKWRETLKSSDLNPKAEPLWDLVRKGISWFKENNAKAYMVLLD
jgi:hypothetical protein